MWAVCWGTSHSGLIHTLERVWRRVPPNRLGMLLCGSQANFERSAPALDPPMLPRGWATSSVQSTTITITVVSFWKRYNYLDARTCITWWYIYIYIPCSSTGLFFAVLLYLILYTAYTVCEIPKLFVQSGLLIPWQNSIGLASRYKERERERELTVNTSRR